MLYIASVTSQSGLLLLFIGLIAGCFLVNWTFARRHVRNLRVTAPMLTQVVEGETTREPWSVENTSSKHTEGIDFLRGSGLLFQLPIVMAGAKLSVTPRLTYPSRGVYRNSQVTLTSAAPYGLVRATRQLEIPGEVIVLPRVYEATAPAGAGLDQISGGRFRGGRRVNHGTHFAGVRAWQPGDSIKQVHWHSTARRDQLMVKTFEEELGGRVSILLECASGPAEVVNNAVRAAASLGVAALQEGHHLELHDNQAGALRLAPFSDEGELLLRLARYLPDRGGTATLPELWRKSTIALVGTEWLARWRSIIDSALVQKRRVCVYLPEESKIPREIEAQLAYFSAGGIAAAQEVGA